MRWSQASFWSPCGIQAPERAAAPPLAPIASNPLKLTLIALFALPRPLNCLIAGLSVYVGAFSAAIRCPTTAVWLAALSAALVMGAGNAFNDIMDLEIDRINRPGRPLPAQGLSLGAAALEALLLGLGGLGMAWWLGPATGIIASSAALALVVYSTHLKRRAFWGNLLVSVVAAAAFPYGAIATGSWGRSWIPAGFACLFHLGREIIKDIEDVKGDAATGARTLPLRWGRRNAALMAGFIYLFLIGFTLIPWIVDLYGNAYLGLVLLLDLLLLYVLVRLGHSQAGLTGTSLSLLLKAGMLLGLLAIVAGEIF